MALTMVIGLELGIYLDSNIYDDTRYNFVLSEFTKVSKSTLFYER